MCVVVKVLMAKIPHFQNELRTHFEIYVLLWALKIKDEKLSIVLAPASFSCREKKIFSDERMEPMLFFRTEQNEVKIIF